MAPFELFCWYLVIVFIKGTRRKSSNCFCKKRSEERERKVLERTEKIECSALLHTGQLSDRPANVTQQGGWKRRRERGPSLCVHRLCWGQETTAAKLLNGAPKGGRASKLWTVRGWGFHSNKADVLNLRLTIHALRLEAQLKLYVILVVICMLLRRN